MDNLILGALSVFLERKWLKHKIQKFTSKLEKKWVGERFQATFIITYAASMWMKWKNFSKINERQNRQKTKNRMKCTGTMHPKVHLDT